MLQNDSKGFVGIGAPSADASYLDAALTLTNYSFSSTPDNVLAVTNLFPTGATGITPSSSALSYSSLLVLRSDGNTTNYFDLLVDHQGLVTMGSSYNKGAHLFLTDPDPNGTTPLMSLQTNKGIQSLFVGVNGNVGIGTTSPTSCLSVVPTTPYSGAVSNVVNISNSSIPEIGGGYYNANGFVITRSVKVQINTGSPPVYGDVAYTDFIVSSSGAVGIGTATPAYPLDVAGNANVSGNIYTAGFRMTNGANANYIMQSDASGNASWVPQSSVGAGLWTVSGSNIYNTTLSGYVGIGTSTPAHPLQVNGDAEVYNLYVDASTWMTGNTSIAQSLTVSGMAVIGTPSTGSALTTPSGYSLYVANGILAEKYKCAMSNTSDWVDYVFDQDYKLAPLSKVESYIKDNHHLPDVPSTYDVHCDGIDLAQMDITLLKKIEELTLYVLDLKKDNDAMKAEIVNLKK
jgi:hypothetical protein